MFSISLAFAQDASVDSNQTVPTVAPEAIQPESSKTLVDKTSPTTPENTEDDDDDEASDEVSKNFGPVFDGAFISLSAGMNIYFGDIAAYNLFPRPSQFNEHITSGFKATIGREIKWGLGAQLNYQKGSLIGTRKTGKNSSLISFRNSFYDISLQINYRLNDVLFKKNEYNRFTLYGHLGFGSTWYRSQLFDTYTLNTKDYEGYVESEVTQGLSQKTLSDKVKKAQTWSIPYGVRLNYKFNYKMDFHFDFTQTSTFTDRLDAFSRDWTARDKYNYIGIGITYNFNRSAEDAPKKRAKKDIKKDLIDDGATSNNDDIRSKLGRSSKKKKGKKKDEDEDELLNIRLKLFETQLKLFEMQYLLGK